MPSEITPDSLLFNFDQLYERLKEHYPRKRGEVTREWWNSRDGRQGTIKMAHSTFTQLCTYTFAEHKRFNGYHVRLIVRAFNKLLPEQEQVTIKDVVNFDWTQWEQTGDVLPKTQPV